MIGENTRRLEDFQRDGRYVGWKIRDEVTTDAIGRMFRQIVIVMRRAEELQNKNGDCQPQGHLIKVRLWFLGGTGLFYGCLHECWINWFNSMLMNPAPFDGS